MLNVLKTILKTVEKKDIPPPASPVVETIWPREISSIDQQISYNNFTTLVQKYGESYIFSCVTKLATCCRLFKPKIVKTLKNGALEPIGDAESYSLFKRPNSFYGFPTLIEATAISLALTGNAYWEIIRVNGKAIGFFVLQPQRIIILKDKNNKIGGYEYNLSNSKKIIYKPNDIIHFKIYNIQDDFYGLSPLVAAQVPENILKKVDKFLDNYFENGGVFRGVLETDRQLPKPIYDRLTERFKTLYTGMTRAFVIPILEGGLKFKPVQVLPKDSQAFETANRSLQVLFAVFQTHPGLLGYEKLNHATLRELRAMYWEETVVPFVSRIEEMLNAQKAKFMPTHELDYDIEFDRSQIEALKVNELLKARIATTYGALTINEIRSRLFGLPPVEWGDTALLPLNMTPTDGSMENTPNVPKPKKSINTKSAKQSPIFQHYEEYDLVYNTFKILLEEDFKHLFEEQFYKTAGFIANLINNIKLDQVALELKIEEALTGSITSLKFTLKRTLNQKLSNLYFSIVGRLDPSLVLSITDNPVITEFVDKWVDSFLDIVNETTKKQIIKIIVNMDSNTTEDLTTSIYKVFYKLVGAVYHTRLELISRTEATRFLNFTNYLAHKDCNYTLKEWHCRDVKKSRHRNLHKKVIKMDQKFDVNGYKALFPGDINLPANEVCNCKCYLVFYKGG